MKTYNFVLPENDLNIIFRALGEGRYKDVYQTMELLRKQLDDQLKPKSKAKDNSEGYEIGSSRRMARKNVGANGAATAIDS